MLPHNVDIPTEKACDDLCGDKSPHGFVGWGEAGAGLIGQVKGKPGVSRGGQIAMPFDVDRVHPRAHLHQHKKHKRPWKAAKVRMLCEMIKPNIDKTKAEADALSMEDLDVFANSPKPIFWQKPHMTWDDHFSGDQIIECAAQQGFDLIMTCRRDGLPSNVPSCYFHKKKTTNKDERAGVARFENPVLVVRLEGDSQITHTSFQSTSSTDFASVNAINDCVLCSKTKETGRGKHKRCWGIEMNEARALHLNACGKVDKADHMLKNCNIIHRQGSIVGKHVTSVSLTFCFLSSSGAGSTGTLR